MLGSTFCVAVAQGSPVTDTVATAADARADVAAALGHMPATPLREHKPLTPRGRLLLRFAPADVPVTQLRSITFVADVFLPQPQLLSLELKSPSGAVFDRRSAQLAADPSANQTQAFELHVAGTLIDSSRITGTWSAALFAGRELLAQERFEVLP